MSYIAASIAGAQLISGTIRTITAASKAKKLRGQRTPYVTPEIYQKMVQELQSKQGGDAQTLNYLTNQADRAFDQSAGAALRLGANPNDLSAIFDQKMLAIMGAANYNHRTGMEYFSKLLAAQDVLGQNQAAEWKSKQDMIKDDQQAAAAEKAAGYQEIGSAANAFISLSASNATGNLYTDKATKDAFKAAGADVGFSTDWLMKNQFGTGRRF